MTAISEKTSDAVAATHSHLAAELADIAERLCRSTVQVGGRRPGGGTGSGVIWRADGLIITNAHVARSERAAVQLSDGRSFKAEVTWRDPGRDLAALSIDASALPAAPIGDSSALRVGELVVAVGCPWGIVGALSTGIVHAVTPRDASGTGRWIQADIRLAPGNSGGPLADAHGRVVGINTMIAGGLALAVPSQTVERFLQAPEERPTLGVSVRPVRVLLGRRAVLGLLVLEIASGSAAEAGRLQVGDILIGVGGRGFTSPHDLSATLHDSGVGVPLSLDVLRGGAHITRNVMPRADTRGAKAA